MHRLIWLAVGQRYIHNPGAFDADGDSLAYKMFVPQRGTPKGIGVNLQYQDPNQIGAPGQTEAGASPATFSLNPITGDLIWDAPDGQGILQRCFHSRRMEGRDTDWTNRP